MKTKGDCGPRGFREKGVFPLTRVWHFTGLVGCIYKGIIFMVLYNGKIVVRPFNVMHSLSGRFYFWF